MAHPLGYTANLGAPNSDTQSIDLVTLSRIHAVGGGMEAVRHRLHGFGLPGGIEVEGELGSAGAAECGP